MKINLVKTATVLVLLSVFLPSLRATTYVASTTTNPFTSPTSLTFDLQGTLRANGATSGGTAFTLSTGSQLIWYPSSGAFRAGYVDGTQWDSVNLGVNSVAMGYDTKRRGPRRLPWDLAPWPEPTTRSRSEKIIRPTAWKPLPVDLGPRQADNIHSRLGRVARRRVLLRPPWDMVPQPWPRRPRLSAICVRPTEIDRSVEDNRRSPRPNTPSPWVPMPKPTAPMPSHSVTSFMRMPGDNGNRAVQCGFGNRKPHVVRHGSLIRNRQWLSHDTVGCFVSRSKRKCKSARSGHRRPWRRYSHVHGVLTSFLTTGFSKRTL